MESNVFKEMEELHKQITYHANLYFNKNRSEISDFAYDQLTKRWNELCLENPKLAELFEITRKAVPIREPKGHGLKVIKFDEPMLSLDKLYTLEEAARFKSKFPKDTAFVYELKLDGLALEIEYENWKLVSIKTRGDGNVGEDVTHSYKLFNNIPWELPPDFPAKYKTRGEAAISFDNYHFYNNAASKPAASPRNAVSGWVRASKNNQNKLVVGLLSFFPYFSSDNLGCKTYEELRKKLSYAGFNPPHEASWEAIRDEVEHPQWPADGIVIKINDLALRKEIGENNQFPLWAAAWKFPNKEAQTSIENVEWNTGMTGRITPVGIYEPIHFGGVSCSRATIDNYYQFMRLGLRKGTVVAVTRNGDVIPNIDRVVTVGEGELFKAPEECPSCGSVLELRKGKTSADLICNNVVECPGQLLRRCEEMVSKKCLDIDGLGPVKIAELIAEGVISCTSDILTNSSKLPPKAIIGVLANKEQPLHVIIKALGLPNVDITRAKKIATAYDGSVELVDFLKDTDKLMAIHGISAGIAFPIAKIMKNENFLSNVKAILDYLVVDASKEKEEFWIKGCITGSLGQSRDELEEVFSEHGIELVENLTNDCQFLILGEKPSISKQFKATGMTIAIVDGTTATSIETLIEAIKGLKQ